MPAVRKPRRVKEIEGNRGKRKLLPEPEPTPGAPVRPRHLSGLALTLWKRLTPQLDALGLLTKVDGTALEGVCVAYSRAVQADRLITAKGITMLIQTKTDTIERVRPEVSVSRECWAQVKSFCVEFGLTPASRGRLTVGEGKKVADLESLLASETATAERPVVQ